MELMRAFRICAWLAPLTALATTTVHAQHADLSATVDLSGTWHYDLSDVRGAADPGFDDSGWDTVELPESIGAANVETDQIVWYRRTIELDDSARALLRSTEELAVVAGDGRRAYEVYVDGERVGGEGDLDGVEVTVGHPRAWPIPADVLDDRVTIAVRARTSSLIELGARAGGTWAIGDRRAVLARAEQPLSAARASRRMQQFAGGALFGMMALLYLLLWRRRRQLPYARDFGLTAAFMANWPLAQLATSYEWLPFTVAQKLAMGSNTVASILALQFLWSFLRRSQVPRWLRIIQALLAVTAVGCVLPGELGLRVAQSPARVVLILVALFVFMGLVSVAVFTQWRRVCTIVAGFGVAIGLLGLQYLGQVGVVPMVAFQAGLFGGVALVASMAFALADSLVATLQGLDETNESIRRFVPTDFLRLLGRQNIVEVERGDRSAREMVVLFSDIRGFSAASERRSPEETIAYLNRFLAHMEPGIHDRGGFINQYYGDGLMALFDGGATDAVAAAMSMFEALDRFNAEEEARGAPPTRIGIGLNAGRVVMGTIGGGRRLDAGVVGDAVNMAARVEGMTKIYGVPLLLSDAVVDRLERLPEGGVREIDRVIPVGHEAPMTLFEVLAVHDEHLAAAKRADLDAFAGALDAYRRGDFAASLDAFETLLESVPEDAVCALYADRCRDRLQSAERSTWNGVTTLERK